MSNIRDVTVAIPGANAWKQINLTSQLEEKKNESDGEELEVFEEGQQLVAIFDGIHYFEDGDDLNWNKELSRVLMAFGAKVVARDVQATPLNELGKFPPYIDL